MMKSSEVRAIKKLAVLDRKCLRPRSKEGTEVQESIANVYSVHNVVLSTWRITFNRILESISDESFCLNFSSTFIVDRAGPYSNLPVPLDFTPREIIFSYQFPEISPTFSDIYAREHGERDI